MLIKLSDTPGGRKTAASTDTLLGTTGQPSNLIQRQAKTTQACSQTVSSNPSRDVSVIAGVKETQDSMMQILSKMMERLDKLESAQATPPSRQSYRPRQGTFTTPRRISTTTKAPVICLRCGKEGHYAKGCAAPRQKQQGN